MNIAIVGAGVTGLFVAHYLIKDGHRVTLVERNPSGSVTSIYNAGLLTPSLAPTPNIGISRILSAYLGREGPVYVSPGQVIRNLGWYRRALRKSLTGYEDKLIQMGRLSLRLYEEFFSETGLHPDVIKGVVALYSLERDARKMQSLWGGELLDQISISEMGYRGFQAGIMLEDELSINPAKLYQSLWDEVFLRAGAQLLIGNNIRLVTSQRRVVFAYVDGKRLDFDVIVLTAGSWTGPLCRQLGYNPQILPARGLVILFDTGGRDIVTTPALLEDYGVGLAQHNKTTLRLTGFFEMVGYRGQFSQARKDWLLDKFNRHVVKSDQTKIVEEGVGFRPCTPDQLPVIGLVPGYKNVYVASGNCRLGVTLAPATADVIRSMILQSAASRGEAVIGSDHTRQPAWYDTTRFAH